MRRKQEAARRACDEEERSRRQARAVKSLATESGRRSWMTAPRRLLGRGGVVSTRRQPKLRAVSRGFLAARAAVS